MEMNRWTYTYNPNAVEPPEDDAVYECPVCGTELYDGHELYYDKDGDCVGCEFCVTTRFAEDVAEEENYYKGE